VSRLVVIADPGISAENNGGLELLDFPRDFAVTFAEQGPPSRNCYWKHLPIKFTPENDSSVQVPKPEIFAIAEYPSQNRLYENTRLLVVNWDAANGDPLYRSDVTLEYFRSRADVRLTRHFQQGGLLLVESQAASNRPVQEAYDAILGSGEVVVLSTALPYEDGTGEIAYANMRLKDHPLVKLSGTSGELRAVSENGSTGPVFLHVPDVLLPKRIDGQSAAVGYRDDGQRLWFGWFESWSAEWLPLYFASSKDAKRGSRAVMLCKRQGSGMVIASTLWASRVQPTLASRVVEMAFVPQMLESAQKQYQLAKRRRRITDGFVAALLVMSVVLSEGALVWMARSVESGWALKALAWQGVSGVGAIAVVQVAWRWYRSRLWTRPLGVAWWRTAVRYRHHA
jgi:uncharacterized protein YfiM (DUF2279 family)